MLDEIYDNILTKTLNFPNTSHLDLNKLVISGHSFGGMTAIKLASQDKRIRACGTLDPWLFAYHNEINKGEMILDIP